jgi:hypothetical protein
MQFTRLAAVALMFALTQAASAQSISGFDHRAVLEQAEPRPLVVGEALEQETGRSLPLHFELQVPHADGLLNVEIDTSNPSLYATIIFRTPEGYTAERTQILDASVPAGRLKEREEILGDMLQNEILPMLGDLPELRVLGTIAGSVGRHPAMELIAVYNDANGVGPVLLRIAGAFPPQGERILVTVSQVAGVHVPFTHARDLVGTMSYAMLETLNFRHRRTEDGSLAQLLGALVREH